MVQENSDQKLSPLYYVGIGASAGGLEALEAFFSAMPPDSGLAFIVIQHLSPDYKSLMVELLSKRTSMPVRRAEDGMPVEANTVYLIPPKKQLTIFHGKLILREIDHGKGINLPIDIFFRSLAEDQGEKAIGIILSGTGSDGTRGIRAIKEMGGMVIVQSEETAKFDGMPRSALATGFVDMVLNPEDMPARLVSFVTRPYSVPENPQVLIKDEDKLTRIFAILREHTKVDFTFYKPSTVVRRIDRRMAVNQSRDLNEYVRLLEHRPGEVTALYKDLLIGVTSFFRDREVFEELIATHLPQLLNGLENREVRFWVPGCSTGEEAYTLAIAARECMEAMNKTFSIKIFATDIDRDAILFAGNGLYPESIAPDIPSGFFGKYFIRRDDKYQVHRNLREMVVFARHNVIKDPPFTNIDLLSCRNLLIYLQPVLQQKVMEYINFSLNPGGILILGTSETPGEMGDFFETLHHKLKIFRSKGKKRPPNEGLQFQTPGDAKMRRLYAVGERGNYSLLQREEERLMERLLQSLAGNYFILAAVVNEKMELLHVAGNAEGFLRIPAGKLIFDITRMASKEIAIPLSTGIQKVFNTGEEIKYTNIRVQTAEKNKTVQMRIRILPARKGQEPLAAIFIEELSTPRAEIEHGRNNIFDISKEVEQRIEDLEQELQFTKENLQATIEELETSNEELQATNEELLASNEELQSTNEELQSVNEELHTVNAEYQMKIMELTEITNDLQNLIAATRIGTLFLDENLEVRKFTPELKRVFKILDSDIGRPVSHLSHSLKEMDVIALIERALRHEEVIETEVSTSAGEWFLMRIFPYYVSEKFVSGVVLTFTDIGLLKKARDELTASESRFEKLFETMRDGYALFDVVTDDNGRSVDYRYVLVNTAFESLFCVKRDILIGRSIKDISIASCEIWLKKFEDVFAKKEPVLFEDCSPALDIFYEIYSYSPAPSQLACMVRDISIRKKAMQKTDMLLEILNETQQLTKVGGWMWIIDKKEMFWSDEVYRIHGLDPDAIPPGAAEHIQQSILCYDEADRPAILEAFRRCCEEGIPYDLEFNFTDVNGRRMRIRTAAHAVKEKGKVVKVIGNIMDITPS